MTEFLDRVSRLSPKQLLLLALDQQQRIDALEAGARAPVAIVGMACRFPGGAVDPDSFWDLLAEGRDAIGPVPADRWDAAAYFDPDPDAPGTIAMRAGGFLENISGFDAGFFGISPREARTMDPQQRLLLEVAWEALENAGLPADGLGGTPTGVFVGLCNSDHFTRLLAQGDDGIDGYLASGNAPSVAAGRIAYCLGLQGPAMTVDTACSSSLIALHLACRSVRLGESRVALACGVNVMCAPQTSIALSKSHMLAPDARCKTFDAAADGFARGEGCGVLVLKRLDDAVADGDPILAVVRGTATNQDGRSGGLTVPNGPAQEAVIRAALADAGLSARDIDYVEAHGTGTSLGDPIEMRALAASLGQGREPERPLLVGSVKTNFGHLESAAGIAGVIKVVLSLQHERLPRHLHFNTPSPHIPWHEIPVRVTSDGANWARGERRRRAGVSSFGFSGSNAHIVLEEAPPQKAVPRRSGFRCLPLSARTPTALATLAGRCAKLIATQPELDLPAVVRMAGAGRSHHAHRLAVIGDSLPTVRAALSAASAGNDHPSTRRGEIVPGQRPEVVFLFTGQGAQYRGMGRELYDTHEPFRAVIDECDTILGKDAHGRSLKHVLWHDDEALNDTIWTQPALYAIEVASARMWQSFGIAPAAVIGHSLGEYAAACVAGVFSLADGLKLVAERARLTHALPAGGAMAALFASPQDVAAALTPFSDTVSIAAVNAADNVVISGASTSVERIVAHFAAKGIEARQLKISFAAHSPLVEPALDALEAASRRMTLQPPSVPIAWNRGGLSLDRPDPTYWRHHLSDPVLFGDGIRALHNEGYRTFLEVGPHPTLVALAQRTIGEDEGVWLTSMRRGKSDLSEIAKSLAELYVQGSRIKWDAIEPSAPPVSWPNYPFERREYWITPDRHRGASGPPARRVGDPLVGRRLATAAPIYETRLSPELPAGIEDHCVHGRTIVPGPLILALAQRCADDAFGSQARCIERFAFRSPLALIDEGRIVQTQLVPAALGRIQFTVSSRSDAANSSWTLHAQGELASQDGSASTVDDLTLLERRLGPQQPAARFFDRLAELGVILGATFRVLGPWRSHNGESLVRLTRPAGVSDAMAEIAMIDGALQAIGLAAFEAGQTEGLSVLSEIDRAWWRPDLPAEVLAHARLCHEGRGSSGRIVGEVFLRDAAGVVIGHLKGVTLERAASREASELCYQVAWKTLDGGGVASRHLGSLPSTRELAHVFDGLADGHGLAVYDQLLPLLDRLSADAVGAAFRELGFDARPNRTFLVDEEARALGIVENQRHLFRHLLSMLAAEGTLSQRAGQWTVSGPLPSATAGCGFVEALSRFPGVDGELRVLERCAHALARVLCGQQNPLDLLFPNGSFNEARAIYVESPFARTYNETLVAALRRILEGVPADSTLRVLEIGAGTGGTTRFVLPALPPDRTNYTFTDLSPAFLEAAAADFASTPFLTTAVLDMERDPAGQGFKIGSQDVVIAANVLHATTDLARSLRRAHDLLAPGGVLLLLEGVAPERWVDLTFGMTKGWWHFSDAALRRDYPLVGRQSWLELLAEAGFESVVMTPEHGPGARARSQQALIIARRTDKPRPVTIVASNTALAESLRHILDRRGVIATVVDKLPAEGVAGDLVHLGAAALAGTDFEASEATAHTVESACIAALQDLVAFTRHAEAGRVWLVTCGAQAVDREMAPGARWQAPVWGLGRVFGLEHPDHWGGLVDLPPSGGTAENAELLMRALDANDSEDQIAFRGGRRLAGRLVRAPAPDASPISLRADGTYLVTGGFGGLGASVARWLAESGAGRIILAGRHPHVDAEAMAVLEATGADVVACRLDIADEAQVATFVADLAREGHTLRGIVHAAADLSSGPLSELNEEAVAAMLRPKVTGTAILERLTRSPQRDFLLLFSSSTSLLGAAGFGHYAAANAFLDATALSAPPECGRILTINWGTWQIMRATDEAARRSYRMSGIEPLDIDEALDLLSRTLAGDRRQSMIARLDWSRMKPLQEARRPRPFLAEVTPSVETGANLRAEPSADPAAALKQELAVAPAGRRDEILTDFVRATVATTLGDDVTAPSIDVGMFDLGMDSLMAVELKRRLEAGIGANLPSTFTFNHPTIRAMAAYIGRVLIPSEREPEAKAAAAAASSKDGLASQPVSMSSDLDALSDDDITARLLARLKEVQ